MNLFLNERQSVVDTCIQLADLGYLAGTGGNLAIRLDEQYFAVTPSAADYYQLKAEDICVLRLSDLQQVAGQTKPSVESAIHAIMLSTWPTMKASSHTHQPIASAVALLYQSIPIKQASDQAMLGKTIEVASYGPSGTSMLKRKLQKKLQIENYAYLLGNHGVICVAPTLEDVPGRLRRIEELGAVFLQATILANPKNESLQTCALSFLKDYVK